MEELKQTGDRIKPDEESVKQIARSYGLIKALSRDYHTIWLVDKETLRMHIVRSSGVSAIKGAIRLGQDEPDFDTALYKYIENYVEPEDRERLHRELLSEVVLKRISENDLYEVNYLRRDDEGRVTFHQIAFADADTEDGVSQFVFGFRDIDRLVREERRKREELEEARRQAEEKSRDLEAKLDIINSIVKIFGSIYYMDMHDYSFIELGAIQTGVRDVIGKGGDARVAFEMMCKHLILPEHVEMMREFTDVTTLNDRLKDREYITLRFCGPHGGWSEGVFIAAGRDEYGSCEHVIWATRSIDADKKKEERLEYESFTDELTGLRNRRAYENAISECDSDKLSNNLVYVSIDINGLKVVNDTIGHAAGDELISGAAEIMRMCFKPYGRLFRIGGDEFAAIIYVDERQLQILKKDIEEQTEKWKGKLVDNLSLSCGYVRSRDFPKISIQQLAAYADERMYSAKADYYSNMGVDRRGQRDAHTALCALYTKILKIDITNDVYQIINMDEKEKTPEKGFSSKISDWLKSFGTSGQVHPEDLPDYLRMTELKYLSSYFKENKTSLSIFYRRKYEAGYRQVMMEIIPANDYTDGDQTLFLYVKDIDR